MPPKIPEPDHDFTFQGKKYHYTSGSHYKCEFCDLRSTWNAITRAEWCYTFVCDEHFVEHCQTEKAARFQEPRPGEEYTLTTIGEFLQGIEQLKAMYRSRGMNLGD